MSKGRLLLALPLFLVLVSGCPKKSGTVGTLSGKVTYKGKEVTGGQMTFFTKEGGAVLATIKPDGTYSVRDLAVGEATVTVDTKNLKPANAAAVFLEWQRGISAAAAEFPGYQTTEVYPPQAGDQEWVVVVHFGDAKSLQDWLDSPKRAEWAAEGEFTGAGKNTADKAHLFRGTRYEPVKRLAKRSVPLRLSVP